MSAWPTAASRRLELFSAFSGNPDGFVCLVYIALHCSAICKRDQCWLPIFQSLWHHHHLIPIMGEKSLFQVAAVEFGRGSGAPFVPAHLISKMRGISAHMTQHFQDKILRLIWSHIFLDTYPSAVHTDISTPRRSQLSGKIHDDKSSISWLTLFLALLLSCQLYNIPHHFPIENCWAHAQMSENKKVTLERLLNTASASPSACAPVQWAHVQMSPVAHSRRTNKHRLPDPSKTSVSVPAAQQLSQYRSATTTVCFLELLSTHKSHRHHVQILLAQFPSPIFSELCYCFCTSLASTN